MTQSVHRADIGEFDPPMIRPVKSLSFLRFLSRYPIFLLAFGPPIFRDPKGIDATKGMIDVWSFLQVGLLSAVAIRAIYRLASAKSILIPKQVRSILKVAFILGLVFLASAAYAPSRLVSAAYSIFYLMAIISVAEFIADVYWDPPIWMESLFHLRTIALLLLGVVLLALLFAPILVVSVEEMAGVRLRGNAVAPVDMICPVIAIISAYTFTYRVESRARSALFFLVGLAGTFSTQSRGAELALLFSLAVLGYEWAKTGKRSAFLFLFGSTAFAVLSGIFVWLVGGSRIWSIINRGESVEGIKTASGRTDIWKFVIKYCINHPQGMGYITGFRVRFREYFALGLQVDVNRIGSAHNTYMQVLSDAGWISLMLYLILLTRIVVLGRRSVTTHSLNPVSSNRLPIHAIRCSLVLLFYFLANGMGSADFTFPLRASFYFQNITIAIILGISANLIAASRARYSSPIE